MLEWIPVCAGAVLGVVHQRGRLRMSVVLLCSVLCGIMTTVLSGEFTVAPLLVFVDAGLAVLGVGASLILQRRFGARAPSATPPELIT